MPIYTKALIRQLQALSLSCKDRIVDTVYIGGGTPGLLKTEYMLCILEAVHRFYRVSEDAEMTIETNPATVSKESLSAYRKAGINRISFGVQSSDSQLLHRVGRVHSYDDAVSSVLSAESCGFDNISVDLMYGLPGQTKEILSETLSEVVQLPIKHISLYGLKVEENTPFGRDPSLILPEESVQCDMYLDSVSFLRAKGFLQYEISNFAHPGYESKHNMKYWTRADYLGFGPAAHSFFDGVRFCFQRDIKAFIEETDFSVNSCCYSERAVIGKREAEEEKIMLSLRTVKGVAISDIIRHAENRTGLESYLKFTAQNGYAVMDQNNYRLTSAGMLVSNTVISDILSY